MKLHTVLDKIYHIHFQRTLESDSDVCSSQGKNITLLTKKKKSQQS